MHVRRSLIGLIVMSVAAFAAVLPLRADDEVRRRAEALARDATAEFDKAMPATAEPAPDAALRAEKGGERAGPLGPVVDWLGRAADVYSREIFPRLVAGRSDEGADTTTLAAAEDWLRRAGQTYQTVVVPGLAEAQAPTTPKAIPMTVAETVSPTPRIDEAARQNELKRLAEVKADEARKAAARRAEDEARRVADAGVDAEKKKAEEARAAARKAAEEKLEEARREQAARLAAEQKAQAEAAAKKSEQDKKAAEEKVRVAADEKARFDAAKSAVEKKIMEDAAREAEKARAARPTPPINQPIDGVAVEPRKRAGDAPPSPATMLGASVAPGPALPATPPAAPPAPATTVATPSAAPSKPAGPATRSGSRTADAAKAQKSGRAARLVRTAAAKPTRTLVRHQPPPRRVSARVCPPAHKFRTKTTRRT
jgi:hypothetical protein